MSALSVLPEDLSDGRAHDRAKQRLAAGEDELIPAEVVDRIVDGENKLRVWREYRGMSAKELAEATGLAAPYISQRETGKREGTIETFKKIAAALRVDIDDVAWDGGTPMITLGKRLIKAANEARAIARGEADPATYEVFAPAKIHMKAIRAKTDLTQEEFSIRFAISLVSLRDWQQGRFSPDPAPRAQSGQNCFLADRIATRLRARSRPGRTVPVRVRFADLNSATRSVTLDAPISATVILAEVAEQLVRAVLADRPDEKTISLQAISVSHLEEHWDLELELPLGLDDEARRPGTRTGMARWATDCAVDKIRDRFGWDAIGYGSVALGISRSVPDAFRELAEKDL